MENCFVIFEKNNEIVRVCFNLAEAHHIAKDKTQYDKIYWCVPHLCNYNQKREVFVDADT